MRGAAVWPVPLSSCVFSAMVHSPVSYIAEGLHSLGVRGVNMTENGNMTGSGQEASEQEILEEGLRDLIEEVGVHGVLCKNLLT